MNHWSPEEDAIIARDAAARKSTSEMVVSIKDELGIVRTRSAVLGRAQRKGVLLLGPTHRPLDSWANPKKLERLEDLWRKGLTITAIAKSLSSEFKENINRSAVVSKAHRAGIAQKYKREPRTSVHMVVKATRPRTQQRPPRPVKPVPKAVPVDTSSARPWLTRLRGECKFPLGEAGDIHSCCAAVFGNTGYCQAHAAICFLPRPVKRVAA